MKKIYISIIASFFFASLMAQIDVKSFGQEKEPASIPGKKAFTKNKSVFERHKVNFSGQEGKSGLKSSNSYIYQLDSTLTEYYSDYDGAWVLARKEEYVYDSLNNMVSYIDYEAGNPNWIEMVKYGFTYDENGLLTLKTSYGFISDTEEWYEFERFEYSYNEKGKVLLVLNTEWDGDREQWVQDGKVEFIYNDNGELFSITYGSNDRDLFSYDESGRVIERLDSYFDGNYWKKNSKEEFYYNSRNQVDSVPRHYWEPGNEEWVNYARNEYSYDENGNPIQDLYFQGSGVGTDIIETEKFEFYYDLNYYLSNLIIPSFEYFEPDFSNEINNKPTYYNRFIIGAIAGVWLTGGRTTHYYLEKEVPVDIINYKERSIIFPNPASDYIEFYTERLPEKPILEIFDIQGKKVFSKGIIKVEKVYIGHLERGIYFYRLSGGSEIYSGKILIQK